jgi:thiopeptide-type bacteriocin biosynthesis protein
VRHAATGEYVSVHIFYNTLDLRPVIIDCVDPLVTALTEQGLISRFFFIRYWENGLHLRLRVLPADPSLDAAVRREIDSHTARFLEQQGSLFDPDPDAMAELMRMMYEFEHGKDAFVRNFGQDGRIALFPNNSVRYIPYKPEFGRYGGPLGVEIAHENFHVSSLLALEVIRNNNNRFRNAVLGVAFQLMIHFVYAFYGSREGVSSFFRHYAGFFEPLKLQATVDLEAGYDLFYGRQSSELVSYASKMEATHEVIRDSPNHLGEYINHAYEMHGAIKTLHERGELTMSPAIASLEDAVRLLLRSYVHMMNNRLGVIIFEEIYLANLIYRALDDE